MLQGYALLARRTVRWARSWPGGTVSLDGYIAGPNGSGFEHLFAWFAGGDRTIPSSDPAFQIRLSEPHYEYMRDLNDRL
jgi:hypothetical protein